jgi:tubulin---tyrosine ligase
MLRNFQALPNAFELFGIDLLVTHASPASTEHPIQVKLLEINAEPDIELTGPRLTWILENLFVAMGKACVEPFIAATFPGKARDEKGWGVGEIRHGLRKCLEVEVRGCGG